GRAIFDWRDDGLHCSLSIPLYERPPHPVAVSSLSAQRVAAPPRPQGLAGHRVLAVEGEALGGSLMRGGPGGPRFSVIGPFNRLSDATAAAENDAFDAAVLDINLDGQSVYSIADILAERGIPFVFVTGYGTESIDPRFASVPVLQKPIERQVLEGIFV